MSKTGEANIGEEIKLSVSSIPFVRALGVEYVSANKANCRLRVPIAPRHKGAPGEPGVSAGFIAGVLDQLGSCTLTSFFGSRHAQATLSMSLSFAEDLTAATQLDTMGEAMFETGQTGSVAMRAQNDEGAVLAQGLVSFMIGSYPGSPAGNLAHDHEAEQDRDVFAPEQVDADNFEAWMGLKFGLEESSLGFANRLIGSTGPVVAFHGGVVAAAAIGDASHRAAHLGQFHLSHFTLEYLRAAKADDLVIRTRTVRQSRRTLVLQTDLLQDDGKRHVATTTSRFVAKSLDAAAGNSSK